MVRRLEFDNFRLRIVTCGMPVLALGVALLVRYLLVRMPEMPFLPHRWMLMLHHLHLPLASYLRLGVYTTLTWIVVVDQLRLYEIENVVAPGLLGRVVKACAGTYFVVFAVLFFIRHDSFSRPLVAANVVALCSLTAITLNAYARWLRRRNDAGERVLRVLILGADAFARQAAAKLCNSPLLPVQVVGYVCLPGQTPAPGEDVFPFEEAAGLATSARIDDVVVAVPPAMLDRLPQLRGLMAKFPVPVRLLLDLGDDVSLGSQIMRFGETTLVDLVNNPAPIRHFVVKRVFDVVFSSVVLVIVSPLLLLVALAVKLSSTGPVLFRQKRVGLNGRLFTMYKFRTMRVAEARESDVRWTTSDDPRCTPIGSFLRRTSLDELPQFFNVLRGDMSVVGPRPERLHFVNQFLDEIDGYNRRHVLKVGITGWAQVNGLRGDSSIDQRVQYDLYYMNHWSLRFDLRIILLTFFRGFVNKNAY